MKTGIMQPYFFPYIGYFQLINYVDKFVIYDNIEYTKKGWINRNRFLKKDTAAFFSIPLKKDSDFLTINQRYLSLTWNDDKIKILNQIKNDYKKAPYFNDTINLFEMCLNTSKVNLFDFIYNSLVTICNYLDIKTEIIISSSLQYSIELKSTEKVIAICKELNTLEYLNSEGGMALYDKNYFAKSNLNLKFLKSKNIEYKQFENEFIPFLSILDILMFNPKEKVLDMINNGFELL